MTETLIVSSRTIDRPDQTPVGVVTIAGKVEAQTAPQIENAIDPLFAQGVRHLILDCGELLYINSTGAGLLIKILDRFEEAEGTMRLSGVRKQIRDLFGILGFQTILQIESDVESAVTSIGAS